MRKVNEHLNIAYVGGGFWLIFSHFKLSAFEKEPKSNKFLF